MSGHEVFGQMECDGVGPLFLEVFQGHFDSLADDSFVLDDAGADQIGSEFQDRLIVEDGLELFVGEFGTVALDAWEGDGGAVALGADRAHLVGFPHGGWFGDDGAGGEVEGDPEDIGVFDIEEVLFI